VATCLVRNRARNGELANDPRIPQVAANPVPTLKIFLLFFTPSAASQAAGKHSGSAASAQGR